MSASDLIGWAILGGLDVLRVRATVDLPAPVLALILLSVAKLASGRSSNKRDRDAMLSGHNEWVKDCLWKVDVRAGRCAID